MQDFLGSILNIHPPTPHRCTGMYPYKKEKDIWHSIEEEEDPERSTCGSVNKNGTHRLTGSGPVRRCGFVGGSLSLSGG